MRIAAPALEAHIDAIPSGKAWLRTSPELHMKRLLAAGYPKIYQMGPCFRADERGERHHPEFCMLEWYHAGGNYLDILEETQALLRHVSQAVLGRTSLAYAGQNIELAGQWPIITVAEAFLKFAGWNPAIAFDANRFELDLVEKVEPKLTRDRPVVLMDYPAEVAALARRKPQDQRTAERWELYIGGLEIANAFGELTDPAEQRARFAACAAERNTRGQTVYPLDHAFLAALEDGLPDCAGIALGVDRLLMLLTGALSLDSVLPFRD